MPALKELKRAMETTRAASGRLQERRDERKRGLLAVEERRIVAELALEYSQQISDAATVAHAANLAYYAALEAHAKTGAGCSVPIGTKMVQWKVEKWSHRYTATGLRGVVEAVTRETKHGQREGHGHKVDMTLQDYIFSAAIACLALCLIWGNIVARREE